uniref:Uncharacterized protein n=1 Tax=viral metagenome TaxID=1070528 RepID=A0A6C0B417_9ZZZZ
MEHDNNYKIMKVIYNIFTKKIPSNAETYKDILTSINIKNIDSEIPSTIINKLEQLYIKPKNIDQIMFLFIGELDKYEGITTTILNDFSQFIITGKKISTYKNLKILKKAFGTNFNTELNITSQSGEYLYSKIYFIDKHISKINTINEVENIICTFINTKIRTNTQIKKRDKDLEVNKILLYTDCHVDNIILKNVQSNIMLTLKNNNFNFREVENLLAKYYVPKLIIKKINSALYSNKFIDENIPEIITNKIINVLIKLGIRFRTININKFGATKFTVSDSSINTNISAYFEKDTVYTSFNDETPIKSTKLLGDLTASDILYFYNYKNVKAVYNDADILDWCFPFRKKTKETYQYNDTPEILDKYTKTDLKLEKILMTDIKNTCILSQNQHSLIDLFNNIELSFDIPFAKFNDIQGSDEVCKLFTPILKQNGNLKPLIRKNTLKNWCSFNCIDLSLDNLDQLRTNKRGRKKSNASDKKSVQNKLPQIINKKVILFFKIKLSEILSTKKYKGKIYNFINDKLAANIIHSKGVQLDIKKLYSLDDTPISMTDASINDEVLFKKKKILYGDVLLYNIEHSGKTLMNVQINTVNLKHYDLFNDSETFIEKINDFLKNKIIGDKFYTGKFVISYNDLNTPIVDIEPYYNITDYKIYYHFIIRSDTNFSIINSRIKLIDVINRISPFITIDDISSKFKVGETVVYLGDDDIKNCTIDLYNSENGTYTIKLSNKSIIDEVEYKYLKNPNNDSIIINFRHKIFTYGEKNTIVIDFNNKYTNSAKSSDPYDTRKKVNCIIMGCSSSLALRYIKTIIKQCFLKLEEDILEETSEISPEIMEETMIGLKAEGGGDDDVLEDDSDDSDDDSDDDLGDDSDGESINSPSGSESEEYEKTADEEDSENESDDSETLDLDDSESRKEHSGGINKKTKEKSDGAFLNRLYQYDEDIFAPSFPDGDSEIVFDKYDKVCQSSRLPKVLNHAEKEEVDRIDRELEDKLRQEPGKENIEIKSYGFGPFDRDCEYQSKKSGFDKNKLFFDSKLVDDAYIDNYGDDEEYKEIVKLILIDKKFILNKKGDSDDDAEIKWSFTYSDPSTNKRILKKDLNYRQLKQLFNDNEHIRGQNPPVSAATQQSSQGLAEVKTYPISKICNVRIPQPKDLSHIEADYKNLLNNTTGNVKNVGAMKCKSIKYGTDKDDSLNWYMCPRLYDRETNRPLHWRMLKYTKISGKTFEPFDWADEKNWRKAKHDLTLDIMDFNPEYPQDNPEPDRLWVYPKSGGVGGGGAYFYPGFLSHTKHPLSISREAQNKEPIFPPCCYQKYSNRFSELLNPETPKNVNKCGEPLNRSGDKYFTIGTGIEGNLGKKLNKLFNQEECNGANGFIRKGIDQGPDSYFNLIFDILDLSTKKYKTSITKTNKIKDTIVNTITNEYTNNRKVFFNDINGGFLEILFRKRDTVDSFQNFIEYTLSEDVKRYDLFYEITTSPQFIKNCTKKSNDLILIVFEVYKRKNQSSYSIKINCPYFSRKLSVSLQDLITDDTRVAFAIKYNSVTSRGLEYIFEPIYYKKSGSNIDDDQIIKTFKISDINRVDHTKQTLYLKKIKNIIDKFKDKCSTDPDNITLDLIPTRNMITFRKLENFIRTDLIILKRENIYPSHIIKDSNNKVSGINFKYNSKIYTIPIFPESIVMNKLRLLTLHVDNYYYDGAPKFKIDGEIMPSQVPNLSEYEIFYNNIENISKESKSSRVINIKPLKYFGVFTEPTQSQPSKINLDVKGFSTSFLSADDDRNDINIERTLVYIPCNGTVKSLSEDQIIFNYNIVDKFLEMNETKSNKIQPIQPIEIGEGAEHTLYHYLKDTDDFGVSIMYLDNSGIVGGTKIVLIKSNAGVFIPIMPLDKTSTTWDNLNFTGIVENLYIDQSKTKFNKSIKITEPLLNYCQKIKDLSKITNFKLPIFIKNLNINNISDSGNNKPTRNRAGEKIIRLGRTSKTFLSSVYLESGIISEFWGSNDVQPLEIVVVNPVNQKKLEVTAVETDTGKYIINEVKKCNLNFYTQRYINDNNLNISLDFHNEFQASKFKYDSIIYEVLIKKLNEFFSRQLNKSVKQIKLFIQKIINKDLSNKSLHQDIKKRLLYPLLYEIISIVTKPVDLEGISEYPPINIDVLSNIEFDGLVNLEDLEDFEVDDVDKYIIKSYALINNDTVLSSIETLPDALKEHNEYKNAKNDLDFTKVTKLYYALKEYYRGKNYLKLEILDETPLDGGQRSEILKHKLCNNIIYNSFIQEQVFGTYKPNITTNSRFKYNIGFEILFTKSEKNNYEKLNSLYAVTKHKYFRDIKYPSVKNLKKGKIYKFKEKGTSKVIPFLYNFRIK